MRGLASDSASAPGTGGFERAASPFRIRLISAALAAPVILLCAFLGDWWFRALIHVTAALAGWEWGTLIGGRSRLLPTLTVLAALAFPLSIAFQSPTLAPIIIGAAISLGILLLPRANVPSEPLFAGAAALLGGTYAGALLSPAMLLRDTPLGLTWVFVIILGTWACDTVAYAVGRRWGHHPLAPPISPSKTIEGTIAGLAAAVLVGIGAAALVPEQSLRLVGLAGLVGLSAVGGDLIESAAKRRLRVKDSGWIMPGHGGILDRIDSLILAALVGYVYVSVTELLTA